mgnify:CR=1 FL=1
MAEAENKVAVEETAEKPKKSAPKKTTAKKAEGETKKTTKKAAAESGEKAVKKAAPKKTAKADGAAEKPAKKTTAKKTTAKKTAKKAEPAVQAPRMHHGRVVVESKTPLYKVKNEKGQAPYVISDESVKVTLIKSTIGCLQKQKATVAALGLKKPGSSKIFKVSPALNGMLFRVRHLIKVEEVK